MGVRKECARPLKVTAVSLSKFNATSVLDSMLPSRRGVNRADRYGELTRDKRGALL